MRVRESTHHNERPEGVCIDTVVLHYISLPDGVFEGEAVDALFMGTLDTDRAPFLSLAGLRVSSHYFIRRSGEVRRYVDEKRRAWHAGVSRFHGRDNVNDFSIGIELEGDGRVGFEDRQYEALVRLLRDLAQRHPLRWVTGHEHVAPGRKADPGPHFDWRRVSSACPELAFDLRAQR